MVEATRKANEEKLLTIGDVEERLSLSRSSVYKLLDSGRLRSVKLGSHKTSPRRIYDADLNAYIESLFPAE